MTKREITMAYKAVEAANIVLDARTGILAQMASEALGYEVSAEVCSGGEIEFRKMAHDGIPDPYDCIRIEDILNKMKE